MDNDDLPIGKILTRREALALLGTISAAALAACAPGQTPTAPTNVPATKIPATNAPTTAPSQIAPTVAQATATTASAALPSCIVRPELTEGPYFVDEKLNRSDIRSDTSDGTVSPGAPLALTVLVSQINGSNCTTLPNAQVDVWHCDAAGVYSGVTDPGFNSQGSNFLRGYQTTDENGMAKFVTIYPGWYRGRAVHIHFKIRTNPSDANGHEFTSQWFFDEALTDQVHAQPPYDVSGKRTLLNDGDGIFRQSGGQTMLDVSRNGDGYAATFNIGLQLS
ncbi:MAG: intradiol ring-cleavage dioxygenase [Chloroflexota bacterium]|nr:MAG: intradiol ring-cleavage dioxygenase [Chloroflexota bacterium]